VLADKGKRAPHYLWCADECEEGDGVICATVTDATVSRLCRDWYRQLPKGSLPDDSALFPLREAIQRVAATLNRLDWQPYAPVTDDFVVIPADGTHSFCADYAEMLSSIPPDRLDLLRSRLFLGTEEWWELS
jgi:hypothetical protein